MKNHKVLLLDWIEEKITSKYCSGDISVTTTPFMTAAIRLKVLLIFVVACPDCHIHGFHIKWQVKY